MDDDAILAQSEGAVRRYCRRRTDTPEDADDAVQDTFIRFVRRPERDVPNPEAWLLSAARYACADVRRRRVRDGAHAMEVQGPELDDPGFDAGRLVDAGAVDLSTLVTEQAWLRELFHRLSPRDRLVMDHLYVRDASLSDLARLLGVTVANAGVIANRARNRARAILEDMGRGLGGLAPTPVLAAWRRLRARLGRVRHQLSHRTGERPLDPDLVPRITLALRVVPLLDRRASPEARARTDRAATKPSRAIAVAGRATIGGERAIRHRNHEDHRGDDHDREHRKILHGRPDARAPAAARAVG